MPHLKECTNEASGGSFPPLSVFSPPYTLHLSHTMPQNPLGVHIPVKSWCMCWCVFFPAAKVIILLYGLYFYKPGFWQPIFCASALSYLLQ